MEQRVLLNWKNREKRIRKSGKGRKEKIEMGIK